MDFSNVLDGIYNSLNEVRVNPRQSVHNYSNLQRYYNGTIYRDKVKTREGVKALRNLLDQLYLKGGGSSNKLKWSFALHMAADEQASKLGEAGIVTTQGTSQHVPLPERCKKYAIVRGRLSEVYEFGGRSPDQILEWLLIDDGLVSRKRRNTLLDPIYKYIGVGSCFHQSHGTVTVIILAEDVISLVAPEKDGKYRVRQPFGQGKQTRYQLNQQIEVENTNQLPQRQEPVYYRPSNSNVYTPRGSSIQANNTDQNRYEDSNPSLRRINSREERVDYGGQGQTQYQYYKRTEAEQGNNGFVLDSTPQANPHQYENREVYRSDANQSPQKPKKEESSCEIM